MDIWDILNYRQRRKRLQIDEAKLEADIAIRVNQIRIDREIREEANSIKRQALYDQREKLNREMQAHYDKMSQEDRHHLDKIRADALKQDKEHDFKREDREYNRHTELARVNAEGRNQFQLKLLDSLISDLDDYRGHTKSDLDHGREVSKGTSNALNTAFTSGANQIFDALSYRYKAMIQEQVAERQHNRNVELENIKLQADLLRAQHGNTHAQSMQQSQHKHEIQLAEVMAKLKIEGYLGERTIDIVVRIVLRELGLEESKISREKLTEQVRQAMNQVTK